MRVYYQKKNFEICQKYKGKRLPLSFYQLIIHKDGSKKNSIEEFMIIEVKQK